MTNPEYTQQGSKRLKVKPDLVQRPSFGKWTIPTPVADFTDGQRPAIRVKCNCRNCHWQGEARFPVSYRIPEWVFCPKCEVEELSAHGEFLARDEKTVEEELAEWVDYQEKMAASEKREREIRDAAMTKAVRRLWKL